MKSFLLIPFVALLSFLTPMSENSISENPLVGSWEPEAIYLEKGDSTWTEAYKGLLIFTETHYSVMYSFGESRPSITDETTDEEKLAIFNNFTANAGTYSVEDNVITLNMTIAKWPNGMEAGPVKWPPHTVKGNKLSFKGKNQAGATFTAVWVRAK